MMGKLLYTNPKFKTISEEKFEVRSRQRQILKNKMHKKAKKLAKRQNLYQQDPSLPDPEDVYE
jgi:hypothetical protein